MTNIILDLTVILILIATGSFFIPMIVGRFIGINGVHLIIFIFTLTLMIVSSVILYLMINENFIYSLKLINWVKIELINISLGILIDPLSSIMLFVVTIVSFCANIYSMEYMNTDPYMLRYFSYLSLFTFFMIILVISENMLQLFIGWEGVGICSYILINFWYCRVQANKSSILAVLANKAGDITLLIAASVTYYIFKTSSFYTINNLLYFFKKNVIKNNSVDYINVHTLKNVDIKLYDYFFIDTIELSNYFFSILEIIVLLCIIACIGKSAQFGFHFWLPEAMEGPTPVSSLIHAATMVTAGIFLILRISNMLVLTFYNNTIILIIGSTTLFFAASIGLTQIDIKKIVAYSTCSQLGYMFLSCGFYGFNFAFYHLFIHAFFKALLFLTSGYVIHLLSNEQDIRKMGGLLKISPFSYILMLIGSYALIGLPFISGAYSKETLLEFCINKFYNSYNLYSNLVVIFSLILSFVTVVITLIYSLKSISSIYLFNFKGFKNYILNIHYSTFLINTPLILLSMFSIYFGYLFNDLIIGINSNFIGNSININTNISNVISEYYTYYRVFVLYVLLYFIFMYFYIKLYYKNFFFIVLKTNRLLHNLYYSINKKYLYLNRFFIYNNIVSIFNFSYVWCYKLIDKGLVEIFGPYGITYILYNKIINFNKLQSGYIYHYLGYIFIVLIVLFFIVIYNF